MNVGMMLWLVLGCGNGPALSLLGSEDTAIRPWEPDATGAGGLTFGDDACWVTEAAPSTLPDAPLALDSCVRLSPEEIVELDTGAPYHPDTGGGGGGRNPLCSVFNLIGSTALAGGPDTPAILYCDTDDDGGVRLVRVAAQQQTVTSVMLAPGECWADPDSGAIRQGDGGVLDLAWVASRPDEPLSRNLLFGQTTATGALLAPMAIVPDVSASVRRLALLDGRVLWSDDEGLLAVTDLDTLTSKTLATQVGTVAAQEVDDGTAALAWCSLDDALHVGRLGPDGSWLEPPQALHDASCGFETRPSVAATSDTIAIVWHDAAITARLATTGAITFGVELEALSFYPRVHATEGGWLIAHTTGVVERRTATGAEAGRGVHPAVAAHAGSPIALRWMVDEQHAFVAFVGLFNQETAGGHTNMYHYLEASTVTLGDLVGTDR